MAARWGGDEFVILLRDTDEQEARAIVKRVQLSLRRRPIARLDGRPVNFSVGFAPLSGETMEAVTEAVKAADAEMYATKRGDTLQPS
jgi:diguanylate cyclase (GGDEF)-like protein